MGDDEEAGVEWMEDEATGTGSCLGRCRSQLMCPSTDPSRHLLQRILLTDQTRQIAWFHRVVFEDLMHVPLE